MRVFKTRWIDRFARRERVADSSLRDAIARAERGLVDADLGGGLLKQRVAREGQGRSGGYRMMVAYRAQGRAVFLYAFAKNERDNVDPDELLSLRQIAEAWLAADDHQIALALTDGALQEIEDGEEIQHADRSDP